MKWRVTLLGAMMAPATGCFTTIVVDGTTVREDAWTEAAASVTARATADLGCGEIKLTLFDRRAAPAGRCGSSTPRHRPAVAARNAQLPQTTEPSIRQA